MRNRQRIAQAYQASALSRAAQACVDGHPQARCTQDIAAGLPSVFKTLSLSELGQLADRLSGRAFDICAVPSQRPALRAQVRSLPGLRELLTSGGGLDIWHVALR